MRACGLIVEYNPFHNGHLYHLEQSKQEADAECMVAVMSGQFLQRGEPAIIDKWHRTEAALRKGVDLVLELPYIYAVEHSDHFSKGAVRTLSEMGVKSLCFGSEHGEIGAFETAYRHLKKHQVAYDLAVRTHLNEGYAYPEASRKAYEEVNLPSDSIDLTQPNNILGYSYVKQILTYDPSMTPLTIKRTGSNYHDEAIPGHIASATSIRKQMKEHGLSQAAEEAIPDSTVEQLLSYRSKTDVWHDWEHYFHLLHYKILTMSCDELRSIHGVDEGLEHRLKRTIKQATSFESFMNSLKTKRYTWTRLQRTLVHILIGTQKSLAQQLLHKERPPYARVLGMNDTGRQYLNEQKKKMDIPLITQPQQLNQPMLELEERASVSYYSVLKAKDRVACLKREYGPPIMI